MFMEHNAWHRVDAVSVLFCTFFLSDQKDCINFACCTCPQPFSFFFPVNFPSFYKIHFNSHLLRKLPLASFLLLLPILKELSMASSVLPLCPIDKLLLRLHNIIIYWYLCMFLLIICLLLQNRSHVLVYICISQTQNQPWNLLGNTRIVYS